LYYEKTLHIWEVPHSDLVYQRLAKLTHVLAAFIIPGTTQQKK